ncbi:MAG: hypothetical protein L0211_09145 [Planctomycetaceae bacterium]|nr:hypothetical protein [Planctomycetaceae bacterium]
MLPKYGAYALPEGRCKIVRRDTPEFNEARQLLSNTIRLECSSALYAESATEMDGLVRSLLDAFRVNGKDFIVQLPGGSIQSQLTIRNTNAIGGVRVVQPPEINAGEPGAYVTWLPFTFALEAEYPSTLAGFLFREYTDSISYSSPEREAWLLSLHGPHQRQRIRQFPFYRATQTGRAVGYLAYPEPASPIWPQYWMNFDERPSLESPRARGNGYIDFPISWNWRFEANRPLVGTPTAWPQ